MFKVEESESGISLSLSLLCVCLRRMSGAAVENYDLLFEWVNWRDKTLENDKL